MPHYDEARGLLNGLNDQAAVISAATHAATSKATPVDADELPLADSASSFSLKKLTWANLKATLAAWINGNLIPASFTTVTTSGDVVVGAGTAQKKVTVKGISTANGSPVLSSLRVGTAEAVWYVPTGGGIGFAMAMNPASYTDAALDAARTHAFLGNGGLTISGTLTTAGGTHLHRCSSALTSSAGASVGTLTNAPAAGNPTKWISIDDNGTFRYIPVW